MADSAAWLRDGPQYESLPAGYATYAFTRLCAAYTR